MYETHLWEIRRTRFKKIPARTMRTPGTLRCTPLGRYARYGSCDRWDIDRRNIYFNGGRPSDRCAADTRYGPPSSPVGIDSGSHFRSYGTPGQLHLLRGRIQIRCEAKSHRPRGQRDRNCISQTGSAAPGNTTRTSGGFSSLFTLPAGSLSTSLEYKRRQSGTRSIIGTAG